MKALTGIKIIAVLAVVALAGSLIIYSGAWPPVYTVESESMEHSTSWTAGTINVGDIVMVKNINNNSGNVVTYVTGRDTGYSTYGEYGNVILYKASNGEVIIHRAMFYLSWNGSTPVISGYNGQSWIKVTDTYVVIDNASYTGRNLYVSLAHLQNKSGFITVGDYNLAHSTLYNSSENAYTAADQNVFGYNPAGVTSVLGVAFGQLPWFGLIKLNIMRLSGDWTQYNQVPANSYLYLAISLSLIILVIFFPYNKFQSKKDSHPPENQKKE